MKRLAAAALLISMLTAPAGASQYSINVTRTGSNFYDVRGANLILQTTGCISMSMGADATLNTNGYTGSISFMDGTACKAVAFFGTLDAAPGNYTITLRPHAHNWYAAQEANLVIHTPIVLPTYTEITFTVITEGSYEVTLPSGSSYQVDAYEQVSL